MLSTVIYKVLFSCCILATLTSVTSQQIENKISVQVFYEALCPDSIAFFRDQLLPLMRSNNRRPYIDLKLIPFGKAIINSDENTQQLVVECQHGEQECEKNALHACILETTPFEMAFDVIACLMRGRATNFEQCAHHFNMDVKPVNECKLNRSNAEILEKYGKETAGINISFVPSIAINYIFNYDQQSDLLYRFDKTICRIFNQKFRQNLAGCPPTVIREIR